MAKPKAKESPKRALAKPRIQKSSGPKPSAPKSGVAKSGTPKSGVPKSGMSEFRPAAVAKPKAATAKLPAAAVVSPPREDRLERLWTAVQEVREGRRDSPRTARLLAAGPPKLAQKVVEEAGEVAIEAVTGKRDALINESVDLLYNLVALWNGLGVEPRAIWAEMDRREDTLGMAEKLPKTEDM